MWLAGVLPKTRHKRLQEQGVFVVDLWFTKRCNLNRDARVGQTSVLLPASNLHIQHLNLLCVSMQTFNSTTDSSAVSDTLQNIVSTLFWRYCHLDITTSAVRWSCARRLRPKWCQLSRSAIGRRAGQDCAV